MNDRLAILAFVCILLLNMAILAWAITESLDV